MSIFFARYSNALRSSSFLIIYFSLLEYAKIHATTRTVPHPLREHYDHIGKLNSFIIFVFTKKFL